MFKINILDYSPIFEGSNGREALLHTREMAQLADQLGYARFWVSEHHHVFSVAGSTPEMLMMQLAASTNRIRIGSGGVMLPHYSPYKVAENFRMLEAFHPNRIDLGIGRSLSFRIVRQALNEGRGKGIPYEQQVKDLMKYLTDNASEDHRFQELIATPVIDTVPEMWLLGTGTKSAQIAAENGTAFAFAHFSPATNLNGAKVVADYRKYFQPSAMLKEPKVMVSVFAIIAETMEEAEEIAQAFDLWLLAIESEHQPPYYPSIQTAKSRGLSIVEKEKVQDNRKRAIIGDPKHVHEELEKLATLYQADEVMIVPQFYGYDNRLNGITLLAEQMGLAANNKFA